MQHLLGMNEMKEMKAEAKNCCGVTVMKESSNSFKDGKQSMITLKFGNTKVYLKNVGVRDSFELESRSLLVLGIEEKLGMQFVRDPKTLNPTDVLQRF